MIGRNNDLIGQILKVCGDKRKNKKMEEKKGVFSKRNREYGKGAEKKGSELTLGTVKLMAIFLREEDRRHGRLVKKAFVEVLGVLGWCRRREKWILGCRLTRWRRSTREGSIYRTKWAGANLTYSFAASVKSEGVQVDMVTVCAVIKGLCR